MEILSDYEEPTTKPLTSQRQFNGVLESSNPLGFIESALEFVARESKLFQSDSVVEDVNLIVRVLKEKVDAEEKKKKKKKVNGNGAVKDVTSVKKESDQITKENTALGRHMKCSMQQGNERKILVRSVNMEEDNIGYRNEDGDVIIDTYKRQEFHIVDLKLNKIYRDCLPSLFSTSGLGYSMVATGHSIFIFGDSVAFSKESSLSEFVQSQLDSRLPLYTGASHLHFNPADFKDGSMVPAGGGTWGPAPPANTPFNFFSSSSLERSFVIPP